MPRFRLISITVIAFALLVTACGDDDGDAAAPSTTVATTAEPSTTAAPTTTSGAASTTAAEPGTIQTAEYLDFRNQPTACGAEAPAPAVEMQFDSPADLGLTGVIGVTLHTSCGKIEMDLFPDIAPATVNSFVFLAEEGYFDGTVVHRVSSRFVMQAGDPSATGSGGPGYTIPDELPPENFRYIAGTVAMANAGAPDSGGSQFFIIIEDSALPPAFTAFGFVTAGLEATALMEAVPMGINPGLGEQSRPLETIYLERVEIDR